MSPAQEWRERVMDPMTTTPKSDKLLSKSEAAGTFSRLAIDMGPLFAFFGAYFLSNLFVATGVYLGATIIALSIGYSRERRIAPMPLLTGVIVMIFGGLTLLLNDKQFILMKPTIVNMLFASILFAGLVAGRPLMKYLFAEVFELTEQGWTKISLRWALFFVFLALLNEAIWRNFSESFWVTFKIFGILPLTLAFGMAQVPLLRKYAPDDSEVAEPEQPEGYKQD